jgi:hypothetical protein
MAQVTAFGTQVAPALAVQTADRYPNGVFW